MKADTGWGPAHELAHACLATPEQSVQPAYGLCSLDGCACPRRRCTVVECAAMMMSAAWVTAAGREDLVDDELSHTVYVFSESQQRRARELLAKNGLWPIPRSAATIHRFITTKHRREFAVQHRLNIEFRVAGKALKKEKRRRVMGQINRHTWERMFIDDWVLHMHDTFVPKPW